MSDFIKVSIGKHSVSKMQEEKFKIALNKSLKSKAPLKIGIESKL